MNTTEEILLEKLLPNPWQLEGREDPQGIAELAESILRLGLLEAPLARPIIDSSAPTTYQLASGHRRLAAHKLLVSQGHAEFAKMQIRIAMLSEEQMAATVIDENKKRRGLDPIGEAKFYRRYLAEFKVTQAQLAEAMGCSQSDISNTLRLLDLPENVQGWIISGEITPRHGRELLRVAVYPEVQAEAVKLLDRLISAGNLMTVDQFSFHLDREMASRCKPLNSARFEQFWCEKCDQRLLLRTSPASTVREPFCAKWDCFKEKQKEAADRASVESDRQKLEKPDEPPPQQSVTTERQNDGIQAPRREPAPPAPIEPIAPRPETKPPQDEPPEPNYAAPVPKLDVKGLKIVIQETDPGRFLISIGAEGKAPVMKVTPLMDLEGALAQVPEILNEAAKKWAAEPKPIPPKEIKKQPAAAGKKKESK